MPSPVRQIDVRKQHSMSFRETWRLCIRGVRHRLFRSVLTLAVVVLAVAFFMFLLSESMYQRAVGRGVTQEDAAARASQTLLTRLTARATDEVATGRLAAAHEAGDEAALDEAAAVSGLSREEVDSLAAAAFRERTYADWVRDLPPRRRIPLFGKHFGREAFAYARENRAEILSYLDRWHDVRVPLSRETFESFLDEIPGHAERMSAFLDAWNAGVDAVRASAAAHGAPAGANADFADWILAAPDAEAEAWRAETAARGFRFDAAALARMREQFGEKSEYDAVIAALNDAEVRKAWSAAFHESKQTSAEAKLAQLADPRARELLAGRFAPEVLDRAALRHEVSSTREGLKVKLAPVLRSVPAALGLTGRQIFLLAISFLVCMVGIANAMLMSITERYREIATMKCLGATDGYILSQFMLEAALQGFFGGVLGAVFGFVIATIRNALLYGGHLWTYFPAGDLALCFLFSLAAGVLLSALASIQPSWSASRMAPMEAMRVE